MEQIYRWNKSTGARAETGNLSSGPAALMRSRVQDGCEPVQNASLHSSLDPD